MSGADDVEIPEVEYVSGSGVPIRGNDIDTDQIIPARFMKVVTFDGLGSSRSSTCASTRTTIPKSTR